MSSPSNAVLSAPHHRRRILGASSSAPHPRRRNRIVGASSSASYHRSCIVGAASSAIIGAVSSAPYHRRRIVGASSSAPHHQRRIDGDHRRNIIGAASSAPHCRRRIVGAHRRRIVGAVWSAPSKLPADAVAPSAGLSGFGPVAGEGLHRAGGPAWDVHRRRPRAAGRTGRGGRAPGVAAIGELGSRIVEARALSFRVPRGSGPRVRVNLPERPTPRDPRGRRTSPRVPPPSARGFVGNASHTFYTFCNPRGRPTTMKRRRLSSRLALWSTHLSPG